MLPETQCKISGQEINFRIISQSAVFNMLKENDPLKLELDEKVKNEDLDKNELFSYTHIQDRKKRKTVQNMHASRRYRDSKKKEEFDKRKEEAELLSRNNSLKMKVSKLEEEKRILLEMHAKVTGVNIIESMVTKKDRIEVLDSEKEAIKMPKSPRGRPRVEKKLGRPRVERDQPVNLKGLEKYQRMRALNNVERKRYVDSRLTREISEENDLPKLQTRNEKLKEKVKFLENNVSSLSHLMKGSPFQQKITMESKIIQIEKVKSDKNTTKQPIKINQPSGDIQISKLNLEPNVKGKDDKLSNFAESPPFSRERKRKLSNTRAARRYREKFKTQISVLENEEQELSEVNKQLKEEIVKLEIELKLQKELLDHPNCKNLKVKYNKVREHIRTVDIKRENIIERKQCENCNKHFEITDMHLCTNKPNFHCQFCGEMFPNRFELGKHILHGSNTCVPKN